jgi:hypothetical protein
MGRSESPLDPSEGLLAAFAYDLRALRQKAGGPSYRELARKAHFSASTLSIAAGGRVVPSLQVVEGFVRACGGDVAEWTERWQELNDELSGEDGRTRPEEAEKPGPAPPPDPTPHLFTWDPITQVDQGRLEPGDLIFTHDCPSFLVYVGEGRVVNADVWPDREPSQPLPDKATVKAYVHAGAGFFTDTAQDGTETTPADGTRRRPRWVRNALLLAAAAALIGVGATVLTSGGTRHHTPPAGLRRANSGISSTTRPAGNPPSTAVTGREIVVGPGCPSVPGTSSGVLTTVKGWVPISGGPVECGGQALTTFTTPSTTKVQDSYAWTINTLGTSCEVQVYIADANPSSATARYQVFGATGQLDAFTIQQADNRGHWIVAGTWHAPGGTLRLVLTDQADYNGAHHHVTASAASFTCR